MNTIDRLNSLSTYMDLETTEDEECQKYSSRAEDVVISEAVLPGGRRVPLLKTLLTSACEHNCYYCPFRAGRDYRRATFKPDELARIFMNLYETGIAKGIFLSSGVAGGSVRTQDRLLDTAEILRNKLKYKGYLHLKIMPGVERAQVERSMQLADRVSVNLEAPNSKRLEFLSPHKQFIEELLQPLRWVEEIRQTQSAHLSWNGRWPSTSTQFVVGGAGESDLELIKTTGYLYHHLGLQRVYYSAFRPIPGTPLENNPPGSPQRQHRLYQASFLLRDYNFCLEELPFNSSENLPLDIDPKLAWAQENLAEFPIEINRGSRRELIRIPGIGFQGANKIIEARRRNRLHTLSDLKNIGIHVSRSSPFILLDGKRPAYQRTFW